MANAKSRSFPNRKSATLPSEAVLDRLKDLHPRLIDLSLGRIQRLLAALGNPQDRLAPVIHVAGTNGKGSTLAMLRAMLEAAGHRVHAYTSPHLVRFNERIVVAGDIIADDDLTAILEHCEAANDGRPITYFEITTAAALTAFARTGADAVLLETGLGGRFDATNVIPRPALCAITPVSIDHVQFLGEDIASIAFEKAGILKPGVPCVVAPQEPAAASVIESCATKTGAPLMRCGADWHVEERVGGMTYREGAESLDLPAPSLMGAHQVVNAGVAVACARRLPGLAPGLAIDAHAMASGLVRVQWPARLQRLSRGKLADLARLGGPGWELWLDGGHNRAAAEALARTAEDWRDRPLHLVLGVMNSRDPAQFIAPLAPLTASLSAVAVPGEANGIDPGEIAAAAADAGIEAAPRLSLGDAISAIVATNRPAGRILICGSLYLAGAALALNEENPRAMGRGLKG